MKIINTVSVTFYSSYVQAYQARKLYLLACFTITGAYSIKSRVGYFKPPTAITANVSLLKIRIK